MWSIKRKQKWFIDVVPVRPLWLTDFYWNAVKQMKSDSLFLHILHTRSLWCVLFFSVPFRSVLFCFVFICACSFHSGSNIFSPAPSVHIVMCGVVWRGVCVFESYVVGAYAFKIVDFSPPSFESQPIVHIRRLKLFRESIVRLVLLKLSSASVCK